MAARARFTCGSGDRKSEAPRRFRAKICSRLDPGGAAGSPEENPSNKNQKGLTIPTRGTNVTIQPRMVVFRSSGDIGGTGFVLGRVFTACRIRSMQTAQFEIHRE